MGYHDVQTGYVHLYDTATAQPGSDELFTLAAIYTMRNGGSIFTVDATNVPSVSGLAAIFRY